MPLDNDLLSLAREMGVVAARMHDAAHSGRIVADNLDGSFERNLEAELRRRRNRRKVFGETAFRDPHWDILISLMESLFNGRQSFVSETCIASYVPPATAMRHLQLLMEAGWVERGPPVEDKRKSAIVLTPSGFDLMKRYFLNPGGKM